MKKMLLLLALTLPFTGVSAQLPDPLKLMEKSRDLLLIGAQRSNMTLTIYEKNGATRVRRVSLISKTYGDIEKRMIKFLEPAEVRGTALLIIDNDDSPDDMWIYLPALKRTRRIVTTEKGKGFMSSEFSNADMSTATLSDFIISHLPTSGQNGQWVIESKTINEDKADEYGYIRKITYLNISDLRIKKIEFFNSDNVLARTINVLSSQAVTGKEGYIMTEMMAVNHINGRSSNIKYDEINTTEVIPDNTFAVENLTR